MAILKIENISKRFFEKQALNDVSLAVNSGEIYGLLGPNGAGKTTLIRIINQILMPDSGTIFFDDEPIKQRHLVQIGYLPEERGLYRSMRVFQQLLFLAQLRGLSKSEATVQIEYWLAKFDIADWKKSASRNYPKGWLRKFSLLVRCFIIRNCSF